MENSGTLAALQLSESEQTRTHAHTYIYTRVYLYLCTRSYIYVCPRARVFFGVLLLRRTVRIYAREGERAAGAYRSDAAPPSARAQRGGERERTANLLAVMRTFSLHVYTHTHLCVYMSLLFVHKYYGVYLFFHGLYASLCVFIAWNRGRTRAWICPKQTTATPSRPFYSMWQCFPFALCSASQRQRERT